MCHLNEMDHIVREERKGKSMTNSPTWKPLYCDHGCSSKRCIEKERVFKTIVNTLKQEICSAFDQETRLATVETQYTEEFFEFSELDRLKNDTNLNNDEKVNLLSCPSQHQIELFLTKLYTKAEVPYMIQLYSLLLLKRFLRRTSWKIRANNWRILVLIATRLAQKIEDEAILTADQLEHLYPVFNAKEFNHLEVKFLQLLDYNSCISFEEFTATLKLIVSKGN